jgi:quercetin dioxygenase-like cupin family protein
VKVTRRGSGATLWRGAGGGCGVLVAGAQDPDAVELWDWTLAPGDRHASDGHTAGTRELLHVRRGTVTVTVGAETVELCLGDAMAFHGDVPHCYANPTGRPARFSLAVVEPAFGGGSRVRAGHG